MKKFLMLTVMCLACNSLTAVLPPLWQNVAELKAILEDRSLGNHLQSGDVIESIEKIDNGWFIKTNHRSVNAIVHYEPQQMPGPAKFKIEFQAPSASSTTVD